MIMNSLNYIKQRELAENIFLTPALPLVAIEHDLKNNSVVPIGFFENLAAFERFMDEVSSARSMKRENLVLMDGNTERIRYLAIPGDNIKKGNVGVFYIDPESGHPSIVGFQESIKDFKRDLQFLANECKLDKSPGGTPDLQISNYMHVEFRSQ